MESVLVTLDLDKKIRVKVNISNFIIEKVLLIKYQDEKQRLVAYILKFLNETKIIKFMIKRCQQLLGI